MKIIDVMKSSLDILGLIAERAVLESATQETESTVLSNEEIAKLFNLTKFSVQEFCSNYSPVIMEQSISVSSGVYAISSLTNCIRVNNVFKDGEPVAFKIINRNICVEQDGTYEVKYSSFPDITSMFNDVDFLANFSPDVLVFGLCAYFCLSKGMFDQFNQFHDEYIDRAESIKGVKVFEMPERRWEWKIWMLK
mgnify:CR=1 FL=1